MNAISVARQVMGGAFSIIAGLFSAPFFYGLFSIAYDFIFYGGKDHVISDAAQHHILFLGVVAIVFIWVTIRKGWRYHYFFAVGAVISILFCLFVEYMVPDM